MAVQDNFNTFTIIKSSYEIISLPGLPNRNYAMHNKISKVYTRHKLTKRDNSIKLFH